MSLYIEAHISYAYTEQITIQAYLSVISWFGLTAGALKQAKTHEFMKFRTDEKTPPPKIDEKGGLHRNQRPFNY